MRNDGAEDEVFCSLKNDTSQPDGRLIFVISDDPAVPTVDPADVIAQRCVIERMTLAQVQAEFPQVDLSLL